MKYSGNCLVVIVYGDHAFCLASYIAGTSLERSGNVDSRVTIIALYYSNSHVNNLFISLYKQPWSDFQESVFA